MMLWGTHLLILNVVYEILAEFVDIYKKSSMKIKYGAYPYIPKLGNESKSGDKKRRFKLFHFILNKLNESPSFMNGIIWTDECQYTRVV